MPILLKTAFGIKRNIETGKKLYITSDGQAHKSPKLPTGWQTSEVSSATLDDPSFVIKCGDNLVVVDCDDIPSTQAIDNILADPDSYVVVSDKGEKHFYFRPTDYYNESPLKRKASLKLTPIDLQHGNALIFPVCSSNETKMVFNGSIDALTPIPDTIVDYLITLLKEEVVASKEDYKPNQYYLAPSINLALGLYGRSGDYHDLEQLMQTITPYKYRTHVKPDWHPDRIPDGMGTAYLQALSSKIAGDASISPKLHRELITIIATELWEDAMSKEQVDVFLSNLTSQTYQDGKPVFIYNPADEASALITIGANAPTQLYRTAEDEYIIPYPTGGAKIIKREGNLIKTLQSANYAMFLDNVPVPPTSIKNALQKAAGNIDTVDIVNEVYSKSGHFLHENLSYYNMYTPTKFLGIIRGEYLRERTSGGAERFPVIESIYKNITIDHKDQDTRILMMHQYFAHKFKTLDYSPLVFQLLGSRGIGKDTWIDMILGPISGGAGEINMGANNSQFNADYSDKMVVKIPELVVSPARVNQIKSMVGSKWVRQEDKGKTARMVRNVTTYITSANKAGLLAETPTDRRFILLSAWKAKKLNVPNLELKIALELEEYCLYLRDLKMPDIRVYNDANVWHDDIILDAFAEEAEHFNNAPDMLAAIMNKLNVLTGEELDNRLKEALGQGYHKWVNLYGVLRVPLADNNPVRLQDNQAVSNEVKQRQLKQVELMDYISRDTTLKTYNKAVYTLNFDLSSEQQEYFNGLETVAPINLKDNQ